MTTRNLPGRRVSMADTGIISPNFTFDREIPYPSMCRILISYDLLRTLLFVLVSLHWL
jgi:hypothetical protein